MGVGDPARATVRLLPPFTPSGVAPDPTGRVYAEELALISGVKPVWSMNGSSQLTFSAGLSSDRAVKQLAEGWRAEICAGGRAVWGGRLGVVTRGVPWSVTATGLAAPTAALDPSIGFTGASAVAQHVSSAFSRGAWPVRLVGAAPSVPASATAPSSLAGLLSLAANANAMIWTVVPDPANPGCGLLSFYTPAGPPKALAILEIQALPDQAGAQAPTRVIGKFQDAANGTGGPPSYVTVNPSSVVAARRGILEQTLDLTGLGLIPSTVATSIVTRWAAAASSAGPAALTVGPGNVLLLGTPGSVATASRPALGRVAPLLPGALALIRGTGGGAAGTAFLRQDPPIIREVAWDADVDSLAVTPVGVSDASFLSRIAAGVGVTSGLTF